MLPIFNITPTELKKKLDNKEPVFLLDVREDFEFELCHIEGSRLIPLPTLFYMIKEIPKDKEIIAICHHGHRSASACEFLMQKGYKNVKNLAGGIDAWAKEVDKSMAKY